MTVGPGLGLIHDLGPGIGGLGPDQTPDPEAGMFKDPFKH